MNGRTGLLKPGAYRRDKAVHELPRLADADLPLFFEEDPKRNFDPFPEGCFTGTDQPELRHRKKSNVGYADGHLAPTGFPAGTNANRIYDRIQFDPPLVIVDAP